MSETSISSRIFFMECIPLQFTAFIFSEIKYFEIRFENQNLNEKYFFKYDDDGLRYELTDFYISIVNGTPNTAVKNRESIAISKVIEEFLDTYY